MGKKRKRSSEGKDSSASEGEEAAPKAKESSPKRFKPEDNTVEGEINEYNYGEGGIKGAGSWRES